MSDREQLLGMGFDPARVDWALRATQNRGLQPAMDHLFENEGKDIPSADAQAASGTTRDTAMNVDDDEDAEDVEALRAALKLSKGTASSSGADANVDVGASVGEAKSIKCMQCQKIFKNTALANFHAEKSGHDQFEESTDEIKPLTEEEKKERLADLRKKMEAKRAQKAVVELEESKANEIIRRERGKDAGTTRIDLERKQAEKDAAQRKKDKLEEKAAWARVEAQVEADKRERAARAKRAKEEREGGVQATPAESLTNPQKIASSGTAGKDYKETRLQIRRASGGQPYVTTLPSDSTLMQVAEYLAGQDLSVDVETVTFTMQFPRKQFPRSDFSKTLKDLGLTPSAVLIAS